jgi:hypothetical protein
MEADKMKNNTNPALMKTQIHPVRYASKKPKYCRRTNV